MPAFDSISLVKWLHFILLSMAGGGAIVALLLSGFEDEHEDLRGLAATIWKRTATWGFRLAVLAGIGALLIHMKNGNNLLLERFMHIKLTLVLLLLACSEMAPKGLAAGKRGAAMAALLLFLLASFVMYNQGIFGRRPRPMPVPMAQTAPDGTMHADR
ncbi:MAG: hypothetical protein KGN80_07855, partial [Acidobacteriota bacterium]|nr:hypothetical protein [Acidobacteriota bacterium]